MSKTFNTGSHAQFAALSGDFNPMHMDAVAARRTQAGAAVVHGVHTLLWLLDFVAEKEAGLPAAANLKTRFRKLVYVGERADAEILGVSAGALRARVVVDGVEVVTVAVGFGPPAPPALLPLAGGEPVSLPTSSPIEVTLEQMQGRAGRLSFATKPAAAQMMFPHAARYLGANRVAALACSSRLVGMVVPGLNSLFAGLELSTCEDPAGSEGLDFVVTSVDERFRLVRIAVRGGGLAGSLDTISRLPPVVQPTMAAIAPLVTRDEFLGSTALIIGGSRGLGEVTAKVIAAGGGRVIVTYAQGRADADAVAAEINEWGGACETAPYDARQGAVPQLATLTQAPTHLYYFATPTIFRRKAGLFDRRRFEEFNSFYLAGFLEAVDACLRLRPSGISVFYPSTVYVENRPAELTEYAMSKAAGEILCADIQKYQRGVRVLARRLPRLPTDQTSSLVPMETADALGVILPIVREVQRAPAAPSASA